jgi:hypothetical protein
MLDADAKWEGGVFCAFVLWQPLLAGASAGARFRHSCVIMDSKLLVFGGHGGGNAIWSLDTGVLKASSLSRSGNTPSAMGEETPIAKFLEALNLQKYARSFLRAGIESWDAMASQLIITIVIIIIIFIAFLDKNCPHYFFV